MLVLIAFALGCWIGWMRAARRGGTTPDRIQYALAHGIPAALVALVAVTIAARMGWLG
jgi:phosphate/sulfate permease